MKVAILDYGMGNLGSVTRALEDCGAEVVLCTEGAALEGIGKVVLPGVGAFADGMAALRQRGLDRALGEYVAAGRGELLGICLGMQLLADWGLEGERTAGLGLIAGEVIRLQPGAGERVPHVGWNCVQRLSDDPLWQGIAEGTDFYFVHSYHFAVTRQKQAIARTPYCGEVISAVRSGRVYGVQFHPEKSSFPGRRLLQNFLSL